MVAPQPFFRARGTPFSVLHRIRALVTNGYEVDLVTYPFGEDIDLPGLTIFRCPRPAFVTDVRIGPTVAKLRLDIPLYRLTRKLLFSRQYDLIHSHEEAAFFCVNLARKSGLRHLYDMHSSLPQQLENFGKFNFGPVQRFFQYQEDRVLESCDGVITICPDLATVVEAKKLDTPHCMIENTADDRLVFDAKDRNPKKELGLEGREIVIYTGTFEAYQGLDLLVDAFESLAKKRERAHLLLVGGRPEQVDEMRKTVRGKNLESRVTFTGTVHPSEIPSLIDAADIIVSPRSSGTNTPLKIYGYMRTGRPIVATDRFTHTQILSNETAKLVPATAPGLAAGLDELLENPEHAAALAEAARNFADREFSDRSYVDKVIGLYRQVLDRSASMGEPLHTGNA